MAASLKEQMQNMQRAEQMVVIGELAAGLAHEIKNPLSGIKVTLELLSEETCISENDKEIGVQAIKKIKQIELLLKSLLDFAKPPKPQFIITDINRELEKIIQFARKYPAFTSEERNPIKIDMDLSDKLPQLLVDPMQLEQSFLNLILNAFDAMPDGGTVSLRTGFNSIDNTVIIEIQDTGKGIEEDKAKDIFRPFFTTKAQGTGLGLAVTKRFIEQNRGKIIVESAPNVGTTFKIYLPVNGSKKVTKV
jgi:signal transduction histidine kinase